MSTWTEALIPDQSGRVVLITGANSGIGLQAARALAEHGAHVVMACRSRPKAEAARDQILAAAPSAQVSLVDLDLTSLAAVQVATAEVIGRFDSLDVLINRSSRSTRAR